MKFKVTSPVKFNGRVYAQGDTIDTNAEGAAVLPAHCVEEIKAAKAGKKADAADQDSASE